MSLSAHTPVNVIQYKQCLFIPFLFIFFFFLLPIFMQDQMEQTYLFTICHKNLPTPIWHRPFYRSVTLSQQRCLSISKPICPNALDLCRSITMIQLMLLLRQCMVFKLAQRGWKCSWKSQKMPRSLTRLFYK